MPSLVIVQLSIAGLYGHVAWSSWAFLDGHFYKSLDRQTFIGIYYKSLVGSVDRVMYPFN